VCDWSKRLEESVEHTVASRSSLCTSVTGDVERFPCAKIDIFVPYSDRDVASPEQVRREEKRSTMYQTNEMLWGRMFGIFERCK
jgi:hypothetical protein